MNVEELVALGIEIKENDDFHPDSVLIINKANQTHKNSYTCVVNNNYSEDESSIMITVRGQSLWLCLNFKIKK